MLNPTTIQIIKATVPALQSHADEVTKTFYPILFRLHPEVIPYFNQTNQSKSTQPKALANAVVAYGANIDELGNLSEAVAKIVQKHASLGIMPEQYDAVGSCLLQAIKIVLGDAATDEVIDAWGKAYGQLAQILIDAEKTIYAKNKQKPGGWSGEREFKLIKRQIESEIITSFYFEPVDGNGVPQFEAGQFLTLVFNNVNSIAMRRNYSLSDASGTGYLRISVKREPQGAVSNHLHDNVQVGDIVKLLPPCGNFILRENDRPIVLLTGGIGITPAISMLNTVAGSNCRDIRFIHAALNSKTHAFKEHVDHLAETYNHITPFYIYSDPSEQCTPHATGLINTKMIADQIPKDRNVEFYFLGPKPFMKSALSITKELGIPEKQVHYEFFGPAEELA